MMLVLKTTEIITIMVDKWKPAVLSFLKDPAIFTNTHFQKISSSLDQQIESPPAPATHLSGMNQVKMMKPVR
jgi:hypothetical protein